MQSQNEKASQRWEGILVIPALGRPSSRSVVHSMPFLVQSKLEEIRRVKEKNKELGKEGREGRREGREEGRSRGRRGTEGG
jgi:hypothetical protein